MVVNLGLFVALGIAVVLLTKLVVRGIELYAVAGGMSSKAKGQFLGYATSIPELAGTVGTAGNGLLAAGLWNIGSSNIINLTLFLVAAGYYRRLGALRKRKFVDEMTFAVSAAIVPLVLALQPQMARSPWIGALLVGFFFAYLVLDRHFNPAPPPSISIGRIKPEDASRLRGGALVVVGVLGIVLAGSYLGTEAKTVVDGMGVPQWAVGWILGFITSLPELTTFFAVFASAREGDKPPKLDTDCQENLDSLAASNMSNLGLIYPIGIGVFLWVTQ